MHKATTAAASERKKMKTQKIGLLVLFLGAVLGGTAQAQTVVTNAYDIPGLFATVQSYGMLGLGLWATIGIASLGFAIAFAYGRKAKPNAR
jgi:hypothetical protein